VLNDNVRQLSLAWPLELPKERCRPRCQDELDLSWTPAERIMFSGGYTYELLSQKMRSRSLRRYNMLGATLARRLK
jgi:hypothetical protein